LTPHPLPLSQRERGAIHKNLGLSPLSYIGDGMGVRRLYKNSSQLLNFLA